MFDRFSCRVSELRRVLAGGILLSLGMAWTSVASGQVAQVDGSADSAADQRATATMTPLSIVEDGRAADERDRANPLQEMYSYAALRRDNVGRPELVGGLIDVTADDGGSGTRDLLSGWNGSASATIAPPDSIMAAGPSHVVVATNARLKFYTKTGSVTENHSWGGFFGGVLPSGTFTSDPKVIYDAAGERWFILILGIRNSDFHTWYMLAVSDDSNPNGTWMKYAIDSTLNGMNPSGNWSDFPGMGVGPDALYLTANMFSRSTFQFRHVKLRILPMQQLIDFAATLTWTDIFGITDPDGQIAFTIQPAQHIGTSSVAFLVDANPSRKITIFGVNDPLGTATLVKRSRRVNNFAIAPNAEQPGGSPTLSAGDTRASNALWRDGSLYFAQTRAAGSQAAVRWYQIDTSGWPATADVVQQGNIVDASASNFFPSVAVNRNGTLVIGFSRSSTTEFASTYYASRQASDPLGTMSAPVVIKAGTVHYTGSGGSSVRWGDYSGTVVDPVDDLTFWNFNEYPNPANGGAGWRAWVQHFTVDSVSCPEDLTGDGIVDLSDLAIILANFGTANGALPEQGDLDGDGDVDLADLAGLLALFGMPCP